MPTSRRSHPFQASARIETVVPVSRMGTSKGVVPVIPKETFPASHCSRSCRGPVPDNVRERHVVRSRNLVDFVSQPWRTRTLIMTPLGRFLLQFGALTLSGSLVSPSGCRAHPSLPRIRAISCSLDGYPVRGRHTPSRGVGSIGSESLPARRTRSEDIGCIVRTAAAHQPRVLLEDLQRIPSVRPWAPSFARFASSKRSSNTSTGNLAHLPFGPVVLYDVDADIV